MNFLTSIIIPTYNRAQLICDTLDSIIAQTYTNWECIIVDDGSIDNTEEVISSYIKEDRRFKFYKRDNSYPKGANSCRNIGLDNCNGKYVIFFDSDDYMVPMHVEAKVRALKYGDYDYVVAQTRYSNNDDLNLILEKQYQYSLEDLTPYNYISHRVNWLTYDICIKNEIAKSIRFNELLQSGQEYNYFSKLVLKSTKAIILQDVLTLRKFHKDSIRSRLRQDKVKMAIGYYLTYWHTFVDVNAIATKSINQFLLYRCYRQALKIPKRKRPFPNELNSQLLEVFKIKALFYLAHLKLKDG